MPGGFQHPQPCSRPGCGPGGGCCNAWPHPSPRTGCGMGACLGCARRLPAPWLSSHEGPERGWRVEGARLRDTVQGSPRTWGMQSRAGCRTSRWVWRRSGLAREQGGIGASTGGGHAPWSQARSMPEAARSGMGWGDMEPPNGSTAGQSDTCFGAFNASDSRTSAQTSITSPWFSTAFGLIGLCSNLFALCVLLSSSRKLSSQARSSFLVFLCGLVVTDFMGLLVTASVIIPYHFIKFAWAEVDPGCHLCNFLGFSMVFFGQCPLLLGATMAGERFFGINHPFSRSTSISKRRAWSIVGLVWGFSCLLGLLPVLGLGRYTLQYPSSWCFLTLLPDTGNVIFCMLFALLGIFSVLLSFIFNTVSVVTLCRVYHDRESVQRRRDSEVEMMVQLVGIMIIATICWMPLLIFIIQTVLQQLPASGRIQMLPTETQKMLLIYIRMVTWNQILDPWVYILFRRAVLQRIYPSLRPRPSIISLYPMFNPSLRRKLTTDSVLQ
ncbi:thromboxane A2 receptor [Haliaeetus albicilla]